MSKDTVRRRRIRVQQVQETSRVTKAAADALPPGAAGVLVVVVWASEGSALAVMPAPGASSDHEQVSALAMIHDAAIRHVADWAERVQSAVTRGDAAELAQSMIATEIVDEEKKH